MPATRRALDMVAEATKRIRTYSIDEAKAKLVEAADPESNITFVDLRDPRELERDGLLPGAFHATRGMLEFWVDSQSPYYKPIFGEDREFILYCGGGWRSALAAATLIDMGFDHDKIAHIDGGFAEWKKADAPIVQKAERPPKAEHTAQADKPAQS
jgi:rhodanese-related sulfurtransferase